MRRQAQQTNNSAGSHCDVGLDCCPHSWSGPITGGRHSFVVEGLPKAGIGDIGSCNCPHGGIYMICTGANHTVTEGCHDARLNDKVICLVCGDVGRIVQSSERTYTE